MSDRNKLKKTLFPFFHDSVANYVQEEIASHNLQFIISRPRKTKLGDYRAPFKDSQHVITVNENQNPVQFLITTLHELAHLVNWNKHKRSVKPHGQEWKKEYQRIFIPILTNPHVDEQLKKVLAFHLKNPKASSYSDIHLNNYLKNTFNSATRRVQDTPMNEPFELGERTFIKEKKLRTRYLCLDVNNKKKYLIHGHTELK